MINKLRINYSFSLICTMKQALSCIFTKIFISNDAMKTATKLAGRSAEIVEMRKIHC